MRFAYWTIVIDGQTTAFRALTPEELLPTLKQLQRTSPGAMLRWYQRGRLWESPEAARAAHRKPPPRLQGPRFRSSRGPGRGRGGPSRRR